MAATTTLPGRFWPWGPLAIFGLRVGNSAVKVRDGAFQRFLPLVGDIVGAPHEGRITGKVPKTVLFIFREEGDSIVALGAHFGEYVHGRLVRPDRRPAPRNYDSGQKENRANKS
jgi:hypothetical protein